MAYDYGTYTPPPPSATPWLVAGGIVGGAGAVTGAVGLYRGSRVEDLKGEAKAAAASYHASIPHDGELSLEDATRVARERFTGQDLFTAYSDDGDWQRTGIYAWEEGVDDFDTAYRHATDRGARGSTAVVSAGGWHFPVDVTAPMRDMERERLVHDPPLVIDTGTDSRGNRTTITIPRSHMEDYVAEYTNYTSREHGVNAVIVSDGDELFHNGTFTKVAMDDAARSATQAQKWAPRLKVIGAIGAAAGAALAATGYVRSIQPQEPVSYY